MEVLSLRRQGSAFSGLGTLLCWRAGGGFILLILISSIKPIAQFTSHAGQDLGTYDRILDTTQGKHILWVDLDTREYGLGEVVKYSPYISSWRTWKGLGIPEMLKQLRQSVKEDMEKAPSERIDSVVWYTFFPGEPTARMWEVLDGLSRKHLQLIPLMHNSCRIKPLNTLHHQWNDLESLTLHNIGDRDFMKCAPKIFSRLLRWTIALAQNNSHPLSPASSTYAHWRMVVATCSVMGLTMSPTLRRF